MTRFVIAVLLALSTPAIAQGVFNSPTPIDTTQFDPAGAAANAQAAAIAGAPVQAVNAKTGSVIVPTICRQQSGSLAIPSASPSQISWTFPNTGCAFVSPPSCWADISTSDTTQAFDHPTTSAKSTSGVTFNFTSHKNGLSLNIASLGTITASLGANPIAGATAILTCTAPPS